LTHGSLFSAVSQPTSSAKVHDGPGCDSIAIFKTVILDDQQVGRRFGLSRNNNRSSHRCGYAGACERGAAVQQGGAASSGLWSPRVPATERLRRAAFRINAAALLRWLYATPLLRWLCLCPIETAPVWIYDSALLRRRYGWISIGAVGSPEIQTMRGEGAATHSPHAKRRIQQDRRRCCDLVGVEHLSH
jgi:hypothetical protein